MKLKNKIKEHCLKEIEWAEANIKEMELPNNPNNYTEADTVYLPAWLKAHRDIMNLIENDGCRNT